MRFYFDRKTQQIGIERLDYKDEDARLLPKKSIKNGNIVVSIQGFLNNFGVDPAKVTGRYPIQDEEGRALLIIQLSITPKNS